MIKLTKREHFASIAMQGILSSELSKDPNLKTMQSPENIAEYSIRYADALIKRLKIKS